MLRNLLLGLACNESTIEIELDMSCNNLGAQGAHVLESCIHGIRCISSLDISENSKFNVHGSMHCKNILIYIQQDATLHSLFYLETALHVSGGTTTRHQEHIQLYIQHLVFVTPLLLPAASSR